MSGLKIVIYVLLKATADKYFDYTWHIKGLSQSDSCFRSSLNKKFVFWVTKQTCKMAMFST